MRCNKSWQSIQTSLLESFIVKSSILFQVLYSYYINPSIKNHPTFSFEREVNLWFTHWLVLSSHGSNFYGTQFNNQILDSWTNFFDEIIWRKLFKHVSSYSDQVTTLILALNPARPSQNRRVRSVFKFMALSLMWFVR